MAALHFGPPAIGFSVDKPKNSLGLGMPPPADILLSGSVSASDWAGKAVASLAAEPAGVYTYSLVDDGGGKAIVSRRGRIRLLKNPVGGDLITLTARATNQFGRHVDKTIAIPVASFDFQAGLADWWSTDTLATLKQNTAKTVAVAADADPVASWVGKIRGWEVQLPTNAQRIPYRTGAVGANAALRFPGNSGGWLQSVTTELTQWLADRQDYTIIAVGKSNADHSGTILSWANGSTARFYLGCSPVSNALVDAGQPWGMGRIDDTHSTLAGPTAYRGLTAYASPFIVAASANHEKSQLVVNDGLNKMYSTFNDGHSTLTAMKFGIRAWNSGNGLSADICDIMLFEKYMTPWMQQLATRQIAALRGLSIGHVEPAEIDLTGYVETYAEDFDLGTDATGYFNSDYARDRIQPTKLIPSQISSKNANGSPGATAGELAWMADPRASSALASVPTMSIENDRLVMSPRATPSELVSAAGGYSWLGASVCTKGLVDLEPGAYWEVCVKYPPMLPGFRGSFPAPLWLQPSHGLWAPIEIDAAEMFDTKAGGASGTGADVQGTARNTLSINSHNNFYWPANAQYADSTNAGVDSGQILVPHDLSEDQHLIGVKIVDSGAEVYLDRKLRGFVPLAPNGVYGVTVVSAGDGTIPAGNLVVYAKSPNSGSPAVMTFSTSGGNISGLVSLSKSGAGFTDPASIALYRDSTCKIALGYGVSLSFDVGNETKRAAIYENPMYAIINFALGGSGIGPIDATGFPRPMYIDWLRVYEKPVAAPAIGGGQDSSTTSLMNKWSSLGYSVSTAKRTAIDDFYKYLKAYQLRHDTEPQAGQLDWDPATQASLFQRMGVLSIIGGVEHAPAQLVQWQNPGGPVLSVVGSPVFTPGYVEFSGAIGEYLETSYGLGSSALIDPWDNHLGVYVEEGPTDPTWRPIIVGNSTSGTGLFACLGNSEIGPQVSNPYYNLYGAPTLSHGLKPVAHGHAVWARGYRFASHMFVDGKFWTGGYQTSQTVRPSKWSGSTIKFGSPSVQGAAGKYKAFHAGGRLTMTESKVLKGLLENLWSMLQS